MTALLIAALLVVSACGEASESANNDQGNSTVQNNTSAEQGAAPDQEEGQADTRLVKHVYGETEIPANPERIASINLEDMLLALDVPMILATPIARQDYLFAELESRGTELAPVNEELNYEAILEASPDVIAMISGFEEQVYEQLSKIAPTIVYDRSNWQASLPELAAALGREAEAEQVMEDHAAAIAEAKAAVGEAVGEQSSAIFLRVQEKDLRLFFPSILQEDGSSAPSYVGIAYEELGLTSHPAVEELREATPGRQNVPVSLEIIPELTADHIFIVAISADGTEEALQRTMDELAVMQESSLWATLPALQKGNVHILNAKNWLVEGPMAEKLKMEELVDVLTAP